MDTSPFPRKIKTPTPINESVYVDKSPYNPLCMRLAPHGIPPFYLGSSSLGLNIVEALKLTKSRRRSKSNLTTVDFDNINVCDVKYLPTSYDGDVLYVLPFVSMGVLIVYGCFRNGMEKMCVGHPWCIIKTISIQNDFEFLFGHSFCAGHL